MCDVIGTLLQRQKHRYHGIKTQRCVKLLYHAGVTTHRNGRMLGGLLKIVSHRTGVDTRIIVISFLPNSFLR